MRISPAIQRQIRVRAEHRGQFSVRAMSRCLGVQPSGFHAWLRALLGSRAQVDRGQTELLQKASTESGKVYGYRKLHDDLVQQAGPAHGRLAAQAEEQGADPSRPRLAARTSAFLPQRRLNAPIPELQRYELKHLEVVS